MINKPPFYKDTKHVAASELIIRTFPIENKAEEKFTEVKVAGTFIYTYQDIQHTVLQYITQCNINIFSHLAIVNCLFQKRKI